MQLSVLLHLCGSFPCLSKYFSGIGEGRAWPVITISPQAQHRAPQNKGFQKYMWNWTNLWWEHHQIQKVAAKGEV